MRSLPLGRPALCLHPISGFWSRLCLSARCTLGLGRKQLGSAFRFESAFSPRTRDGYKPTLVALWGLLLTSVLPEPSPAGAEATCALETSTYLFALDVILDFVCFLVVNSGEKAGFLLWPKVNSYVQILYFWSVFTWQELTQGNKKNRKGPRLTLVDPDMEFCWWPAKLAMWKLNYGSTFLSLNILCRKGDVQGGKVRISTSLK